MKSDVSDYSELARAIYLDACAQCPADVFSPRDIRTMMSRIEHEGLSFLTITLPDFCKGVEMALANERIDTSWRSTVFRRFKFQGGGPAFLSGFLNQLFDYKTGRLFDEDTITSKLQADIVRSVRQICLAFKKIEIGCTDSANRRAVQNFVQTEQSFKEFSLHNTDITIYRRVCRFVWGSILDRINRRSMVLRHGPGATAEGISGNQKYHAVNWYGRLDNYFPFYESCYVLSARDVESIDNVPVISEHEELPVKVTLVPKTLKAPRVIAIEPVFMQYAQQGIRGMLYDAIESDWRYSGQINFRDQSINQSLAITSSRDGRLATIDLSDASDRVPLSLVPVMFESNPELWGAILACRSRYAKLPDGSIIGPLDKFASMGSALCFPIESMYFYTICVVALLAKANLPPTLQAIDSVARDVYVYGDDLIVPQNAAEHVLEHLRKYNCRPNVAKTFVSGSFRESCGMDAYKGERVTPVYIRRIVPRTRQQASELVSWSATANLFFKAGYYRTAELMHQRCERILRFYPEISENSALVGRIYRFGKRNRTRFNKRLHRAEVRGWQVSPVYVDDEIDGYPALTKCLLKLEGARQTSIPGSGETPFQVWLYRHLGLLGGSNDRSWNAMGSDPKHLQRTAMHGACTLKLRWAPAT